MDLGLTPKQAEILLKLLCRWDNRYEGEIASLEYSAECSRIKWGKEDEHIIIHIPGEE